MFNFDRQRTDKVLLNEQTGTVASITNTEDGNNSGRDDGGNNRRSNSGE
jgi:phospholipase C